MKDIQHAHAPPPLSEADRARVIRRAVLASERARTVTKARAGFKEKETARRWMALWLYKSGEGDFPLLRECTVPAAEWTGEYFCKLGEGRDPKARILRLYSLSIADALPVGQWSVLKLAHGGHTVLRSIGTHHFVPVTTACAALVWPAHDDVLAAIGYDATDGAADTKYLDWPLWGALNRGQAQN